MLSARFADIEIGVTRLSHEGGQDWAESSPTRGDQHTLMPRGRAIRRTPCEIMFAGADFEAKLRAFDEVAERDEPALFVHPLRGSYRAIVKGWKYDIDETRHLATGACTFVEFEEPRPVAPVSAGVVAVAGTGAMRVAVEKAQAASAAAGRGLLATLSDALAAVEEWAAEDSDLRAVQTKLDGLVARINEEANLIRPSTWESWQLYRSLLRARYQLMQAGQAVVAEADNVYDYVVEQAEPLIATARRLYGGQNARSRADELLRLNGLKTPGMVPAGTKLKVMPQ